MVTVDSALYLSLYVTLLQVKYIQDECFAWSISHSNKWFIIERWNIISDNNQDGFLCWCHAVKWRPMRSEWLLVYWCIWIWKMLQIYEKVAHLPQWYALWTITFHPVSHWRNGLNIQAGILLSREFITRTGSNIWRHALYIVWILGKVRLSLTHAPSLLCVFQDYSGYRMTRCNL